MLMAGLANWLGAVEAGPTTPPKTTRPRATWRENLITMLLATVFSLGGWIEAWAHINLGGLGSFFTPWHAILYLGYAATAGWFARLVWRRRAVPVGYGLGLVGVIGFGVGGVLDLGWHTLFGIEVGIEPLLSPPHLLLILSGLLINSSPLRAAWSDPDLPRAPGFAAFFPVLLSAVLTTGDVAYALQYEMAFAYLFPAEQIALGIPTVLTTNLVLIGTVLLLLRRWRIPFGSVMFLFGCQAVLVAGTVEFALWPSVVAALVGGLVADVSIRWLRPDPGRVAAFRALPALTSLALWSAYMLAIWLAGWLDWSVALWSGVITLAVGSSVALAVLVAPPPVPAAAAR